MSNNKKSSVEWLYTELTEILCDVEVNPVKAIAIFDRLKQAKAMHEEEIVNAVDGFPIHLRHMDGKDYYNETFNNHETN